MSGNRAGHLDRLLNLLQLIAEEPELSVTQAGQRLGMPTSSASRLVALLVSKGFVRRAGTNGGVVPGPTLERFGLRALARLGEVGRFDHVVDDLSARTGESASLGLLSGHQIVLVARKEPETPLRVVLRIGDVIPPHRSAMGRAILAALPEPERAAMLTACGPEPQVILDQLAVDLKQCQRDGYAREDEQFAPGQRCIAAAVTGVHGRVVAGLSIAGPTSRFECEAAVPALLGASVRLSYELGHEMEPVA